MGSFVHNPQTDSGSTPGYQYQFPVFFKDDLPYGPHALEIKPQLGSMVLLDFIQYSTLDTIGATNGSGDGNAASAPGTVDFQMMNRYAVDSPIHITSRMNTAFLQRSI